MRTTVRTYKGLANLKLGLWWHRTRGYQVIGNVACSKRLLRSPLYTVTYKK